MNCDAFYYITQKTIAKEAKSKTNKLRKIFTTNITYKVDLANT